MNGLGWFSARVRRICLVEGKDATLANDSIYVFRAEDFESAFERALELGRRAEQEYFNEEGSRVSWKLSEVLSLDAVQHEDLDGAEVYSEFVDVRPEKALRLTSQFSPEKSEPTQTI